MTQTLDANAKTARTLQVATPTDDTITMTRVFDAPRPLVFEALTRPDLLKRWLHGPSGWTLDVCEVDLRVGGTYRYLWRQAGGGEMGLRGVYREITRPERLAQTELFDEDWTGGETLSTTVLAEQAGRTTLTNTVRYSSREARDIALRTGMAEGVEQSFDALADLLAAGQDEGSGPMDAIRGRYRARADAFERKVAAVRPDQWAGQSPCEDWTARDVVGHIVDMHRAMLTPLGRDLSPAPSVAEDPPAAFRAARADVEALLADPALMATEHDTPGGRRTVGAHIDSVVSDDMVIHGWDLARATGQDDAIDPADVERMLAGGQQIPPEVMEMLRTPGAFGPGIKVLGPEVRVPADAPPQHRLLGYFGRNPA